MAHLSLRWVVCSVFILTIVAIPPDSASAQCPTSGGWFVLNPAPTETILGAYHVLLNQNTFAIFSVAGMNARCVVNGGPWASPSKSVTLQNTTLSPMIVFATGSVSISQSLLLYAYHANGYGPSPSCRWGFPGNSLLGGGGCSVGTAQGLPVELMSFGVD